MGACLPTHASVTLYGLLESGVRWTNHNGPGAGSKVELNSGVWQGSRWGMTGSEDLGGGLATIFRAEAGFNVDTGLIAQQGQVFGRQIFFGLTGGFGTLTFGRQYGASYSAFVSVDPIAAGNIGAVNPFSPLFGVRFDNSIKYAISAGKFTATAFHALGEQVDATSRGSSTGVSLRYADGPLMLTTAYQEDKGLSDAGHESYMIGGTYSFERVKLFAGYGNSRFDSGFTGLPAPTNSLSAQSGRKDRLTMVGTRIALSPLWEATFGYYSNRVGGVPVDHRAQTAYAVLDYRLSKRTDVFFIVDYNKRSNGVMVSGRDDQTGLTLNLRHVF